MQQEEEIQQHKKKTRRDRVWDRTGFRGKTAWDWMELLIVPLVLAVGALLFNLSLSSRQIETEELRAQEERLQTYLEQMGTLLIDEGLLSSEEDDETRYLARARTLAVLREADEEQKRIVLSFLAESGLAGSRNGADPVVSLANTDLAGATLYQVDYLEGADLTEADLSNTSMPQELDDVSLARAQLDGAILTDGLLRRASLTDASLRRASLTGTDLSNANLEGADLREANLTGVNLTGTNLTGADLSGANMEGATGVAVEELEEQAASLEAATMPDGTKRD